MRKSPHSSYRATKLILLSHMHQICFNLPGEIHVFSSMFVSRTAHRLHSEPGMNQISAVNVADLFSIPVHWKYRIP